MRNFTVLEKALEGGKQDGEQWGMATLTDQYFRAYPSWSYAPPWSHSNASHINTSIRSVRRIVSLGGRQQSIYRQ